MSERAPSETEKFLLWIAGVTGAAPPANWFLPEDELTEETVRFADMRLTVAIAFPLHSQADRKTIFEAYLATMQLRDYMGKDREQFAPDERMDFERAVNQVEQRYAGLRERLEGMVAADLFSEVQAVFLRECVLLVPMLAQ